MRRYEILIGFFLGTALWATVMALQSDASALHQICETNQYTGRENCTAHHFLYVAFYYIGYAVNPITVGAAATVAIAVFTYTLYEATIGLVRAAEIQSADMKRSIITSEIAANAADLSARAAVAIQLPIIRIVPDGFGYGFSQNGSGPRIEYCALGSLGLMNHGRTEAFPVEIRCGWAVEKLPDVPIYTFAKSFAVNLILKPGPDQTEWLHISEFLLEFPSGKPAGLHNNTVGLWFYCSVAYHDFMQNRHEAGFCWRRWDVGTSAWFREDATPAYNHKI